MMTSDLDFLNTIKDTEKRLGFKSKKFSGQIVVELLSQVIINQGHLLCSKPNSFISGVPIEIDLLIIHPSAKPVLNVLYRPEEVIAAIEVKKSGLIGAKADKKVDSDFHRIGCSSDNKIKTFYVSLTEDQNKTTELERSDRNFVFFKRGKQGKLSSTGDYDKFLTMLHFLKTSLPQNGQNFQDKVFTHSFNAMKL